MSIEKVESEISEVHQGDRICYNNVANTPSRQLIKKVNSGSVTERSIDSIDIDSIRSGESLFKTFTFDIEGHDPEMKKCLAFWKGILERNIKPVKCSLLKHKRAATEKVDKEEKPIDPCEQEETQQMWMNIYQDLQRKNLDKIKMGKKPKVSGCGCDEYMEEQYNKEQVKEDIKKLNDWSSPKMRPGAKKFDAEAHLKRTLERIHEETIKPADVKKDKSKALSTSSLKKSQTSGLKTSTVSIKTPSSRASFTKSGSKTRRDTFSSLITQTSINNMSRTFQETSHEDVIECEDQTRNEEDEICSFCEKPVCECEDSIEDGSICDPCQRRMGECDVSAVSDEASELFTECGVPCDCVDVCVCQPRVDENSCICGCGVGVCLCKKIQKPCVCSCDQDECICEQVDEEEDPECTCGCGIDECVCKLLYTRSCKCGHKDCDCDLLAILSTYMDTIQPPAEKEPTAFTRDTQTYEDQVTCVTEKAPMVEGIYCVICGHYNCLCNVEKASNI